MTYVCRLCSCSDFDKVQVTDIFGSDGIKNNLPSKINIAVNISVTEDDPLPNFVCIRCTSKMDTVLAFQEQCRQAQMVLWKEYIFNCCARATRLRKDVRMQVNYKDAEELIQRAVSMGVNVNCLRDCLWQATKDLSFSVPNACTIMLNQLATLPKVQLKRCTNTIETNIFDEIEDALPVFCITKSAARCTESPLSIDSDDQVLSQIREEACTPRVGSKGVGVCDKEPQDACVEGGSCCSRSDNNKVENSRDAESHNEEIRVVNESTVNSDEEMSETIGDQTSDSYNLYGATDTPFVDVNGTENDILASSSTSTVTGDTDNVRSRIEVTEFVDVGLFNDSFVRVNNEVKIKEEEEPMLEFTEPVVVYHDEQNVAGVFRPLQKRKKPLVKQADLTGNNNSAHQRVVDAKPIKQESLPVDNLQDLMLFSDSNMCKLKSVKPIIKRNAIALIDTSLSAATQPKAIKKDELQNNVLLSNQNVVVYSDAASQTTEEHAEARVYQQVSGWPATSVPSQAVTSGHISCNILPPAPSVRCSASGRQLPVSHVHPVTASVNGSSAESVRSTEKLGGVLHNAQLMSSGNILPNVLHGPQPAVRYQGKHHLADISACNLVQSSTAANMTSSVEGMQQNAGSQHSSTSFQQLINNNSQSTISDVNNSQHRNVVLVPSNRLSTTSFQMAVSSPQTSISVINSSLLTNVRPVISIQQPTSAISVGNHSMPSVLAVPRNQQPTAPFQNVVNNSQSAASVASHPHLTNVRVVSSIQQPTSGFKCTVSSSLPAVSVTNHPLLSNALTAPSIQHPTSNCPHSAVSNSRPAISVVNHSSLIKVQAVPGIQQPTTSLQNVVSISRPAISVVNHSATSNQRTVPGIQQPAAHLQSNLQPSISVTNHSSLKHVQSISGSEQSNTNLHHVSNTTQSVNNSSLPNVQAVPGIQQPTTSFQNVLINSQPSVSLVNHSFLASVPSCQQPTPSFQHAISNLQPAPPVVSRPSLTNIVAGTGIQHSTSSQQFSTYSLPIISVKHFSRMNADTTSQNKCSDSIVNSGQCTQSSSAKLATDTNVSYQSSVGIQPKQPKPIESVTATSKPPAQVTSIAVQNTSVSLELPIQTYSLSLKAWDSLRDDSNTRHLDASSSRQDSTNKPDSMSNQSDGIQSGKFLKSNLSPKELDMCKEHLKVSGKKFMCGLCKGYLNSKVKCMTHITNHMNDTHFYCLGCKAEVPASRFIKSHLYRCMDDIQREAKYVCMVCRIEFHHIISLQYHYRRHMSLQKDCKYSFLCHPCGKAFVLRQDYVAHKIQVHGVEDCQEKAPCRLTCDKCNTLFFAQSALDRHLAKHCNQTVDDDCQIID